MNIEKTNLNHLFFIFLAMNFLGLGISLFLRVNIGFAAFDTFVITIQNLFNFKNYGNTALFAQIFFFIYLYIFRKKLNLEKKEILITVLGLFIVTRFINLYTFILENITQIYFNELVTFTLGLLLFTFGIYLLSIIETIIPPIDKFSVSYSK